jgi:hypothetical protein
MMNWAQSFEDLKKNPAWIGLGLLLAGGIGFATATAWLDHRIEERIKESEYLTGQLKMLRERIGSPGPKGDTGAPGPAGPPGATVDLPTGAILAFDRKDGCPNGWVRESTLEGMVLVGATFDENPSETYHPRYSDYPTYGSGYADGTYGGTYSDSGNLNQAGNVKSQTSTVQPTPPIYEAAFGTISLAPRSFYALWYCKRVQQ